MKNTNRKLQMYGRTAKGRNPAKSLLLGAALLADLLLERLFGLRGMIFFLISVFNPFPLSPCLLQQFRKGVRARLQDRERNKSRTRKQADTHLLFQDLDAPEKRLITLSRGSCPSCRQPLTKLGSASEFRASGF